MRMNTWGRPSALLFALGLVLVTGQEARAVSYGFGCISNNLAVDCAIGEAQLSVEVIDVGGAQVEFKFTNVGADASSATDVYFDDGSLLAINSVINGVGVDFSAPASPSNLPGGGGVSPPFVTSLGFGVDSLPPTEPNGINPGETLSIIFDLIGGQMYADVLTELESGALRIGLHVQGYGTTGSESFVNIPEPGTGLLMGLGLALLARRPRRG